jgi:predicted dehydrogenase
MKRRQFSRTAFAVGAASALSAKQVFGANDRVRLGLIGSGGRGQRHWSNFLKQPAVEPVTVCDVYEPFLRKGISLTDGRAKGFKDFRQLLEQKDIDVAIVATPDHWHACMTIAACGAGKDVYCEKPLSLTVAEGRKMVAAARSNNRIVQAGSQQRSGVHYERAVKLIQGGGIGEVHRITSAGSGTTLVAKMTNWGEGHRSAVMCHLGNISTQLGRTLRSDAVN